MEIWILRHAKAEEGGPGTSDEERELTAGGHETMRSVARAIARLEPKLDAILTSPLVRARQTAEPVARALALEDELIESDALVPDADPKEILREIGKRGLSRAMVVGHMPHLGRLLGYLLTGRPDTSIDIKKAALARIQFDGDAPKPPGTLTLLLTAKELSGRSKP
jgi:phosphohistidine phosphatase